MDINSFTKPIDFKVLRLDVVTSTNCLMKELLQKGEAREGLVLVAERQTEGRGQLSSKWESQAGANVLCSVLFSPDSLPLNRQVYLNMAICLAVADVVSGYTRGVKVKWPNDVYIGDKKVSGILIENTLQGNYVKHAITGIGINVNQQEFSSTRATSLHSQTNITYDKDDVLQELLNMLGKRYAQLLLKQYERIRNDYHQHLLGWQQLRTFKTETEVFDAMVNGVDEEGRLMLQRDNRVERFMVKQISML